MDKQGIIFCAGEIEGLADFYPQLPLTADALVVCADGGWRHAKALGLQPDLLIGDFDSCEEIPSDVIPFEQAPAMKSTEITDHLIAAMESGKYDFLRCNYPNGDMVGHTGVIDAVIYAVECVDRSIARVLEAADRLGYTVLVTADHGNADQMTETKKGKTSIRTAHSLNPVPFIIYDPGVSHTIKEGAFGLANVAPTVATLLGLQAPASWEASML